MAEKAILYDGTKCTACRGCQVACKQWWGLEGEKTKFLGTYENPPDLSYNTFVKIKFKELDSKRTGGIDWIFTRQACMHCTDAACVRVCPSGALYHHESGAVAFNEDLCTGCGYCVEFCPFKVPRPSGIGVVPIRKIHKCIMCTDRISNNLTPSCVKTCPTGALQFGDRQNIVTTGKKRVQELITVYPDAYLYGEKELGGLHTMYVLPYKPIVHGLPSDPEVPPMAIVTRDIIKPLGYALAGLTVAGLGLNYLVSRANIKSAEEKEEK
jgi:formate dehydrogenase iron-sulfur subunit